MKIHHHPDDATILAYAAGTLNEGFSLVLAAHMEYCQRCRNHLTEAEAIGGEMLTALPPVAMSTTSFSELWKQVRTMAPEEPPKPYKQQKNKGLPTVLLPFINTELDSIRWRTLVPGIRQFPLQDIDSGRGSVRLLSIDPGFTIPQHTHRGSEMSLVLKGAYTDEIGHFRCGDVADLDEMTYHQPVVDEEQPCICLMATDEKIYFTGFLNRMLQPLIGI